MAYTLISLIFQTHFKLHSKEDVNWNIYAYSLFIGEIPYAWERGVVMEQHSGSQSHYHTCCTSDRNIVLFPQYPIMCGGTIDFEQQTDFVN